MRQCALGYLPAEVVGCLHVLGERPTVCVRAALCEARDMVSDLEARSVQLGNFGPELNDMTGPVAAADRTGIRDIIDICASV